MSSASESDRPGATPADGSLREFLHSWRYFFWFLGLLPLVGLFYAEENWRAQWAWNQYQRELAARGEPLSFTDVIPPKVPDSQNFALTPFLAPLFQFTSGSPPGSLLHGLGLFASNYDNASREFEKLKIVRSNTLIHARTDLPVWYAGFLNATNKLADPKQSLVTTNVSVPQAALGVLGFLAEADPIYDELREAGKLPYSRFGLHYEDDNPAAILLPHLSVMKRLTQVLALRVSAELAAGQTNRAFEDMQLLLRLLDACKDEPLLISQLVRIAQFNISVQPLAEGIGQWSEPQLAALQARLEQFDFCADMKRALKGERCWGVAIIEFVRRSRGNSDLLQGFGVGGPGASGFELGSLLVTLAPSGWFHFEKLNYCRFADECLGSAIDLEARQIGPRTTRRSEQLMAELTERSPVNAAFHHQIFARLLLPAAIKAAQRAAYAQTQADCAVIACALERYRLQHGQLPDSLATLEPQYLRRLPHDIINGEPLKYRRLASNQYLIYSVGWNGLDDGGSPGVAKPGQDSTLPQGDWVWRLP
jgi:hypothetical protein